MSGAEGPAAGKTRSERAVLCFIFRGAEVLLIRKKRGLGAGKVNGPGGRIEPGETEAEAAVRETQEEVGVTPLGLERAGRLWFRFTDGYHLDCTVFRASGLVGEPFETGEAAPFWSGVDVVPFERMWADDIHWFHHMVARRSFEGWFEFDGERMLGARVVADGDAG